MEKDSEISAVSDENAMKDRYLTFLIGDETYGMEIKNVMEIIGLQPITKMPEMPDYIRGIINLRGNIIPAMDARLRFKKPEAEYTDRTCVIVMSFSGVSTGLIVDCVSEVVTIREEDISKAPEISDRADRGCITNIGKTDGRIIQLIDCEKLIKG